ncbi:fibronectin type III domain-containing protein [Hymenobacter jeollabukensis]|uniref:T9SS type A sorting domain-containing protein n=1 Tax=Hymenobacter jeollabukensis TaxID=2025313 RepID=A0A5R8WMX3_9BACT|nr:fibronectin type III domain-containing protein [Hymenobacter jeollabukensis]TLM91039.1 T9SS type A sorting domain-containing protein [Hymenobacter jeollabukensis]
MPPALPLTQRLTQRLLTLCRRFGPSAAWLPAVLFASLLSFTAQAQAPANDDPCGAVQLSLNGSLCVTPTVGTNVAATTTTVNGTVANTCGAFNNTAPKDVWYKFTTATTGAASAGATITVTGNPAGLIRLFSASSCTSTFTQVTCSSSNAANTAAPRLVTGALQPGTTYYLQVAGYTSTDTQGQFTICITDPPTCGAPAVLGVTYPTGTSASVSFTPGPGNTTFTAVLQGGAGGQQTVNNATSPVLFTGLTPGTTYFVSVRTDCGGTTLQSPFFSFTVPLLNDDPCGAINLPIGSTCSPTTGTTFGASTTTPNGYTNPGCAADASPMDVWYQFTTPATGGASTSASITVTGPPAGQVRLFSATSCSGSLTQLACSQVATGPAAPLSYTSLTPSTTYYVMVAGYSDTSPRGNFTICVTGAPACPDPTNLAISGVNATTASLSFTPSGNATSYIVAYTPVGGGATTTVTPAPTTSPVALTGLTTGTTYTVTLQSVCPSGTGSVLTRTYTASGGAPANDECLGATPITSIGIGTCGAAVPGTITAATSSTGAPAPGCAGFQATTLDVWFSLTVPANGALQVETGPGATNSVNDTGLALYSGSCGSLTLLGCDDDSSPNGSFSLLRRTGLTPGSTVYVRVWKFGATAGTDFTVCAQTEAPCGTVSNLSVNNITATSAALTFTPPSGATSYTVTYTPTGGSLAVLTPSPTASPAQLTGLTANTTYTVTIQATCTGGSGLPLALTFTTAPPPPANDNCSAPTALTVGTTCTPVTATNVGATASAAPIGAPSCTTGTVNDVWFSLTVPANGIVQVTTGAVSGSAVTDTGLQLYSGTCAALTSLGCNDNFGSSNFSQVRATGLTPGSTVYARVWQVGSTNGGQFTVCAATDPACPAVTNLAVGSITTTSASVTFTPPTAGTSYTVTYTPQGGTATTVTPAPTASPVALTGLLPGTTYTVSVVSNCQPGETSTAATTTFNTTSCIAPTGLSVSAITTTAATVSFGVGNGSTYTVTYTPQGGSPTTVTPNPTGGPVNLTGLTPGTLYTVSIVSNCGAGQSAAATTTFTTLTPCNPVTGLTAGSITTTSASLTFVGAGASYTVTYTPQGGSATTVTPAPTASPVALSGLTPNTQYTVSVTSNCANGLSSTAATTTFTTLAPCNAVTSLTATNVTTTSASLTFTPASAGTSYTVTYTPAGGSATTVTPAPTASPVNLTGLTPNTAYSVSVISNCGGGQTSTAATTTFTTAALPTCAAVTGLTATGISTTTASLIFGGTAGATYTVTYTPQGGSATTVTPAPGSSPVSLTGLTPATQYSVSVVSNCSNGASSSAVTTTFTTLATAACPPVTGLTVSNTTTSGATVSFVAGAGNTTYTVSVTPAAGGTPITVQATASPATFTGLLPGTAYSACVTPSCGTTAGAQVCVTFTTATPTCPVPTGVAVSGITSTGASVTFTPNATASNYKVTYTRAGGSAQTTVVTTSPAALSGLTPNSQYTVSVTSNCPGGATSAASTAATFTTLVTATQNAALAQQVQLYPNPAQRGFWLEVPAQLTRKAVTVTLLNSIGQQVQQRTLPAATGASKVAFDVTQLPRGVYSLRLTTEAGVLVKRLVID